MRVDYKRWAALSCLTILAILAFWIAFRPKPGGIQFSNQIPPGIAEDLKTLIGQPGQTFSLNDEEGRRWTVSPGGGKPIVLIMHMGSL